MRPALQSNIPYGIRIQGMLAMSLIIIILLGWTSAETYTQDTPGNNIEICDNALDDDMDGLTDLNDPDCECPVLEPKSLIPNPSFEEMNCCPTNRSQLNCAETWIQASEPTTDYIHDCGWLGWDQFPPPRPFPDGNGIMGFRDGRVFQGSEEQNWKEYAGACLLGPLKANTDYRFEFEVGFSDPLNSPPINITFFGSTNCENLPFGVGDEAFGCPTNGPGWVRLGARRVSGVNSWVKTSIDITPQEDILAIAIGPDCPGVFSSVSLYYFFDNLVLADQRSFEFKITEVGHPCSPEFMLSVPDEPGLSYQWYKDGVALIGQTSAQLGQMHGEGDYQTRILGEEECKLTKAYTYEIPVIFQLVDETICEGDVLPFGRQILDVAGEFVDTFLTVNGCDSIVTLTLGVQGREPVRVSGKIFEGESFGIGHQNIREAGEHLVYLVSSLGCDSLVQLDLDYYQLYLPNAFSPNGDGQNDHFIVAGDSDLREITRLEIFDRWGVSLFRGTDLFYSDSKGWDGRLNGRYVNNGIYTYLVDVRMADGRVRQFSGALLLLR